MSDEFWLEEMSPDGFNAGDGIIRGDPGPYFTPAVDGSGNISWTNNGNLPNPQTRNIRGPQGDDGTSPTVTVTDITGGHRVTITDADHPSGQSFDVMDGEVSQVEFDELDSEVDDLKSAKAPAIYDTASGAIASFPDGAGDLPLYKLTVDIAPVQTGSGNPSPDNVRPLSGWTSCNGERTGKNRLNKNDINQGSIGSDGTIAADTTRCFTAFIKIAPGSSYTFSCESGIVIRAVHTYKRKSQLDGSWNGRILNTSNSVTFTAGSSDNYCRAMLCKTNYSARITPSEITSPQMENGSAATAFEEYSGEAISVQFPSEAGTVYGGTLTINDDGTGTLKTRPYYASYAGETLIGPWISDRDVYAAGTTPTTGAQVVDMGGTETVYNLTAQQITTLLGTNNVWSNCGDVTVEYPADTKLYIQKINAPTDDNMTADAQIASGKYFIIGNNLYLSTTTIPAGDTIIPGTNCTKTDLAAALNALNV